jgi:hypothetical protein
MNIQELLSLIGDNLSKKEILDALSDGEALVHMGVNDQSLVENAYNYIKDNLCVE